jgi:hypothetical protein
MALLKSEGLKRQDKFIKSMTDQNFDFGLVVTQAFLKGIRDIGYKSTATALFESFDNSIQADADNIHLVFDFEKGKSGKSNPSKIAIVDDGHGMSKEMIRVAVLWGGSDRINDRQGMGKYGYGLPSSCVSIGQRYTVISKREDMNAWQSVTIDIEEISNRDPKYIDPKTGRVIAPAAQSTTIPPFVRDYLDSKSLSLKHGTIILIEKIDRLSKTTFNGLKKYLSLETGITYRNYLRSTNILIDGVVTEPVDPLFVTDGFRFFDENDLRAESLPSKEIEIPNSVTKKNGTIRVRYSYMPHGFLDKKEGAIESDDQSGEEDIDPQEKRSKSKRLSVRKHNNGIIFLRKGRQIDVVDSRCPWTKFQNNDRYVGVEVDFSPELDEDFSITTSKQQIVASERIWNILYDNGVYEAISNMRRRYDKESKEANNKKENEISESPEKRDDFAEDLMKQSAVDFELDTDSLPNHVKKEGEENFEKKVKKIAEETDVPVDLIRETLEGQMTSKPYKLSYFDEEEGPFYRAEQVGGQVVIYLNKAHKFYTMLYNNPKTSAFLKNALAMIIFVLGHSELRVTDEKRRWYKIERNAWSIKLDTSLENLSKHFAQTIDEAVFEEEMNTSDAKHGLKMKKPS